MRPERFVMATSTFLEPNFAQQYSIRDALIARHGLTDTICVTVLSEVNGKTVVDNHFCEGVDEAAAFIERGYQRGDIKAIWSNLQRLKPGSSQRKINFEGVPSMLPTALMTRVVTVPPAIASTMDTPSTCAT